MTVSPESGFGILLLLVVVIVLVLGVTPVLERWIEGSFRREQRRNQARKIR